MTWHSLILDDLSTSPTDTAPDAGLSPAEVEAIRLEGYETGYKSGWDDASAEAAASDRRIAADLERNLADISFTYEEARAEVLRGLQDLIGSIVSTFLPALAAEAVLPRVATEIEALVATLGGGTCELVAAPDTCRQLDWLAERYMELDLRIAPEPAYAAGRVTLRFADETRDIDLGGLTASVTDAIRDFSGTIIQQEEARHA